jgi:stearoyl-CoA desaturase (delta-9 desaturase)
MATQILAIAEPRTVYYPPLHQLWHPAFKLGAPFLGVCAAVYLTINYGIDWWMLLMFYVCAVLTGGGISIGFHRFFTHHSFATYRPIAWIMAILGLMAGQFTLIGWVILHRRHHRHADRAGDPHSPHEGGNGHGHAGWLFSKSNGYDLDEAADLASDRALMWIDRLWWLWYLLGLAIPAALGAWIEDGWYGALCGLVWGGLVRMFVAQHLTFIVNSVGHVWGRQDFRTNDESRNSLLLGIMAMGDGWHNNHHAFPTSARHGFYWWQPDFNWIVIRSLELLHLAWNVRRPPADAIARRQLEIVPAE